MTRTDIINHFIETRGYKRYLEIGIFNGENFKRVKADLKWGVDPKPAYEVTPNEREYIFKMTSDEFFKEKPEYHEDPNFDIVFIDGLHKAEQVDRDIHNSLKILNPGGVVVLHDCNPPTELHARPEYTNEIPEWNGDVYKAWIQYRYDSRFKTYTIDTDWGCGVIDTAGKNWNWTVSAPAFDEFMENPTWEVFNAHREILLTLIPLQEVKEVMNEIRNLRSRAQ